MLVEECEISSAKSFAIAFPVSFFIFFPPLVVFRWIGKSFLIMLRLSLPRTRVTSTRFVFLDTLANVKANVLPIAIRDVCGQYLFNIMPGIRGNLKIV